VDWLVIFLFDSIPYPGWIPTTIKNRIYKHCIIFYAIINGNMYQGFPIVFHKIGSHQSNPGLQMKEF